MTGGKGYGMEPFKQHRGKRLRLFFVLQHLSSRPLCSGRPSFYYGGGGGLRYIFLMAVGSLWLLVPNHLFCHPFLSTLVHSVTRRMPHPLKGTQD